MNKKASESSSNSDWKTLFALIFAGEMIFSLPFHVPRFFRPAVLDSFSLTNTQLGDTFAVYGITAMLCYFPGGIIADYFSAKRLLTFSLVSTALGGFYFSILPRGVGLQLLYGYWGITTVLLFWAGMIKAARAWGGNQNQGKAFGILDGGRGLVAAIASSLAVVLFSYFIEQKINLGTADSSEQMEKAMQTVILFYSLMTLLAALLAWFFIGEDKHQQIKQRPWVGMKQAILSSRVWQQSIIIVSAYCGYKGADNYGLYAVEVLSMNQVEAAQFTSFTAYLRPIGAVTAGFLADRLSASKITFCSFLTLIIVYCLLSLNEVSPALKSLAIVNLVVSYLAVFALRGVYFALVKESKIDLKVTGTAVGFISLIGYTPDIFFAPLSGRLLDLAPGEQGFVYYFILMIGISIVGLVSTLLLRRSLKS